MYNFDDGGMSPRPLCSVPTSLLIVGFNSLHIISPKISFISAMDHYMSIDVLLAASHEFS